MLLLILPLSSLQDRELSHIGQINSACKSRGNTSGLYLHKSAKLVAPVVVVAYNRANYLAKAMVSLLR